MNNGKVYVAPVLESLSLMETRDPSGGIGIGIGIDLGIGLGLGS